MKRCWISILSLMALPSTDFLFGVGDAPTDAGRFEVPNGFLPEKQRGE